MKKGILLAIIFTMVIGCSMTAYAQPETMPDGTVFDAEFYANTYPDVVAVYGTDELSLYQHYVDYGKAERRTPCKEATVSPINNAELISSYVSDEGSKEPEVIKADTTGRKPITPKKLRFYYDGQATLEKIYYRTSENDSWTLFYDDGPLEAGSGAFNDTGTITIYEGYFGVKLVFDNGKTEYVRSTNLVEGQITVFRDRVFTREYTGKIVAFSISDGPENFLGVDWY